ncbi:HET domain-containing protein [Fusarium falciforme]|uniref:HET domain-containing protein n=1 Tax=Fusarium falciforme TaxID=195108 RepID=UPI002300A8D3|nr:HET domain-containing protein [Fusarium falciforme]WAO91181.1 HET domain-containing protein [Fusarium falciforme]
MAFASPWAVAQPPSGFPQFVPALPDVSQAASVLAAAPGPYQELIRREGALQVDHTAAQMRLMRFGSKLYPKRTEAIHLAACAGATNLVEALLARSNGSSIINARDDDGRTALSYIAQTGNDDILEMLLADSLLDVNARDCKGRTPIFHAAVNGHASIVSRLLERGANPNWKDLERPGQGLSVVLSDLNPRPRHSPDTMTRNTPLSCALENEFHEISEMLARADGIDAHAEVYCNRLHGPNTLLELAIRNRDEVIALRLLDKYGIGQSSDYHEPGGELLVVAASIGSTSLVESLLVTHGVEPNTAYPHPEENAYETNGENDVRGFTPLMAAAKKGHGHVVRLLLDAEAIRLDAEAIRLDAGYNYRGTALSMAAASGFRDIVEILVADKRVEADQKDIWGRTPLPLAAGGAHEDVVEALLMNETVDPDCRDNQRRTPLSRATDRSHARNYNGVVRRLLADARVDPNSRDEEGNTPLYYAAKMGDVSLVKPILEHPRIDLGFGDKRAPLAVASSEGHVDVVKAFLKMGHFDVNALMAYPDESDRSPRVVDAIEALLRAERIDPDAADIEGRTPLSVACEEAKLELVDLLLASDGVDPDLRDTAGRNPLSWAVAPTRSLDELPFDSIDRLQEVMRRLLQIQGVDPNVEDVEGLTPLIRAIRGKLGNEFVRVLLEREDVDVRRRSRDGRTPMEFARRMGDAGIMSLLRKTGALGGGNEPPEAIDPSEYSSSDDDLDIGNLRRPRRGKESVDLQTGPQRRRSPSSSLSSAFRKDVVRMPLYQIYQHFTRSVLLPLGAQQEHLDLAEGNDAELCAKCNAIDLDEAFSIRNTDYRGRVIAKLGRIDGTWKARECPMCRVIAAVSSRWRVAAEGDADEDDNQFVLVAFSSTGKWLCNNGLDSWQHFTDSWIDTMFLGVIPDSIREEHAVNSFVLRSGFISRLGSNCKRKTHAITIARVEDGVDFAAAKGWIACCREEHLEWCNPPTLARVPHLRLIDCATRRIVQQGDQVPSYVALSYVWGAPPTAGSGEKSKLKLGNSNLPRDSLDIGESIEAVVEDAIRVTLGLGYEFLWVDRHCILQEGDSKVKEEQLQRMDLVYANAEVTLVATAGQASSSGLPGVSSRCPRVSQPSVRIKGHAITLIPPVPAHQIKSSTWMTRGWTYQEGLLAHRRLFFSESEMSFECRGLLAREAIRLPAGVERQMSHLDRRLMEPSWIYEPSGIVSSGKGGIDLFERLAEYTRRNLTYQSDALNAMLGILRIYATFERSPIYHICGVPILRGSGEEVSRRQSFVTSNDGGSDDDDDAGVALAGFVSGLCWTLQSPGVRRPGFPSWSWTGWHGVVDYQFEEPFMVDFADGFDVEVSIVLADGIAPMPWSDYYGRLRNTVVKESRYSSVFSHHHMLDITADTITARFCERHNFGSDSVEWKDTVCIGDDVWEGDFALTQKDSPPSSGDDKVGFVSSLRRRLLEESWLGIVLGPSLDTDHGPNEIYVLVVQEVPPLAIGAITHWERVGLLAIDYPTLESEMLERRKLRLA